MDQKFAEVIAKVALQYAMGEISTIEFLSYVFRRVEHYEIDPSQDPELKS